MVTADAQFKGVHGGKAYALEGVTIRGRKPYAATLRAAARALPRARASSFGVLVQGLRMDAALQH